MSKSALKDAYARFLTGWIWQWFCTFTFREPPHPEAARKKFNHFRRKINRKLYGPRWQQKGKGIHWVLALEYHKSGVIHFHALMGDTRDLNESFSRIHAEEMWNEIAGFARIRPIDDQLKAVTDYISKYVVKGGEIDLSDDLKSFAAQLSGLAPTRK